MWAAIPPRLATLQITDLIAWRSMTGPGGVSDRSKATVLRTVEGASHSLDNHGRMASVQAVWAFNVSERLLFSPRLRPKCVPNWMAAPCSAIAAWRQHGKQRQGQQE